MLFPFWLTVLISVASLFLAGIELYIVSFSGLKEGYRRNRGSLLTREPAWEYVLGVWFFFMASLCVVGAVQIWYDPTGLVDGFAVFTLTFALITSYALWRWLMRRFGESVSRGTYETAGRSP
jgi:hypothetical protein